MVEQGLSGSFFIPFLRQLAQGDAHSPIHPPPAAQLLSHHTVQRGMGCSPPPSAPLSPHSSSPCVSQAEEVLPIPVPEAASWENAMDNISRENRMTSTAEAQQHGAGPERERETHTNMRDCRAERKPSRGRGDRQVQAEETSRICILTDR